MIITQKIAEHLGNEPNPWTPGIQCADGMRCTHSCPEHWDNVCFRWRFCAPLDSHGRHWKEEDKTPCRSK